MPLSSPSDHRQYRVMTLLFNGRRHDEDFDDRECDAAMGFARIAQWVQVTPEFKGGTVYLQAKDKNRDDWFTLADVTVEYKAPEPMHLTMADFA